MGPALDLLAALLAVPQPVTLADLEAFPRPAYVMGCVKLNERHAEWLREQRDVDPRHAGAWEDAALACEASREPWQKLWCAQPWPSGEAPAAEAWRLGHLAELRRLIGQDAYYHGRMPPLLPPWTLEEKD